MTSESQKEEEHFSCEWSHDELWLGRDFPYKGYITLSRWGFLRKWSGRDFLDKGNVSPSTQTWSASKLQMYVILRVRIPETLNQTLKWRSSVSPKQCPKNISALQGMLIVIHMSVQWTPPLIQLVEEMAVKVLTLWNSSLTFFVQITLFVHKMTA